MSGKITYRCVRKYKYQLVNDYEIDILQECAIDMGNVAGTISNSEQTFIELKVGGKLKIFSGYAWDGPSGPTIDTPNFMRGSLVHDCLYQLMREELISTDNKEKADDLLREICKKDGMTSFRANIVWMGVHTFGKGAVMPNHADEEEKIYTAP